MDFKTMLLLPALTTDQVIDLLQEIVDDQKKQENPHIPQVCIDTSVAGSYSGYFINYDREHRNILLGNLVDNKMELQYLPYSSLTGISVTNIDKYIDLFSDGQIPFVPDEREIPTLLGIKKKIADTETVFNSLLGRKNKIEWTREQDVTETNKFYASKILDHLKDTITLLCSDPLAKEAFQEAIGFIQFKIGESNKVVINNKVLQLELSVAKGWKSIPNASSLKEKIEECL